MKKFVCPICGYVHEGDSAPEKCPQCGCPGAKFEVQDEGKMVWADEHRVGIAKDVDPEIVEGLRMNFTGECTEVGMYLAMARVRPSGRATPRSALFYEQAAYEEAEHAAKFAELLGEVVTDSTKKNLELRVDAENGATAGKLDLAKKAKALNLDAIHDTVHEMAKDEARHGSGFEGSAEAVLWEVIQPKISLLERKQEQTCFLFFCLCPLCVPPLFSAAQKGRNVSYENMSAIWRFSGIQKGAGHAPRSDNAYLFLNCFVDLRNFALGKLRARFGIVYEGAAVIIIKGQTAMQQLKSLLLHAAFVLPVIIHRKFIIKFSAVIIHYEKNSLHDGTAIGHIQAICFDL